MEMAIASIPNYRKFLRLYLLSKLPTMGEQMMTAMEYILNIKPNIYSGIPFSFSLIGKKGAIRAYALLLSTVRMHKLTSAQSHFSFFFSDL